MSGLSTHVLDLTTGKPAAGVLVKLYKEGALIASAATNEDGRCTGLQGDGALTAGRYRVEFGIGDYFARSGAVTDSGAFLDVVPIDFIIPAGMAKCHVPLLASPYGYSTYRGS
jgi:5-hydroxyisourate hydrolase